VQGKKRLLDTKKGEPPSAATFKESLQGRRGRKRRKEAPEKADGKKKIRIPRKATVM